MSSDQLLLFNQIKTNLTRKFGVDLWKLVCTEEMLDSPITLCNQLVLFQELKTNVLDIFGEATWEFLINDELGVPIDENGNYHLSQDQDDSSFIR